jgi:hypothetical protein
MIIITIHPKTSWHTTRWQQRASDHSYLRVLRWFELVYTLQGKNLTNTSYAWPLGSHVQQPSMKSLLSQNRVSAPGIKSWLPAIVWPGHHPGLPHSPSNKPPQSREGRFDKAVTKLLGLLSPINLTCCHYNSKLVHRGQNDAVLNQQRRGLPPWNLGIPMALSPPFPSEYSTFPYLPHPVTTTT